MAEQQIILRKVRDFGENFSDTFQFIRQHIKSLLTSFLLVAGIFILINAIVTGIYEQQAVTYSTSVSSNGFSFQELENIYSPWYFFSLLTDVLAFSAMGATVALYMKWYDEHNAAPSASEIWQGMMKYYPRIFLFAFVSFLMFVIGFIFCFVPGIYLAVVFTPYPFIIVMEDASFGDTFNRCFDLIKENFWVSLGIYFIAGLISAVCSGIIGLIVTLALGAGSYFTTHDLTGIVGIATSVFKIVQHLFYIIFFVSAGLQYFNLVEIKEGTGLAKRLDDLGNNANPNANIEEQY